MQYRAQLDDDKIILHRFIDGFIALQSSCIGYRSVSCIDAEQFAFDIRLQIVHIGNAFQSDRAFAGCPLYNPLAEGLHLHKERIRMLLHRNDPVHRCIREADIRIKVSRVREIFLDFTRQEGRSADHVFTGDDVDGLLDVPDCTCLDPFCNQLRDSGQNIRSDGSREEIRFNDRFHNFFCFFGIIETSDVLDLDLFA